MPPGPTTSTSRSRAEQRRTAPRSPSSRPTSSVDSDGRFPAARRSARAGRVVVEDLALELLQPRSGLEAELVGEPGADPLVRRQRVGLAARPVQRGDQQLPQPLLVGVGRHGGLQLADHGRRPELQPRRELGLDELHARLLEPGAVRSGPVAGRRGSTSPRKRCSAAALSSAAPRSSPGVEPPSGGGGVAQDAERVDGVRLDREPVAAVAAGDHRRVAQRPAQPGDLRLQRVAAAWRRPAQRSSRSRSALHEHAGLEREAHQQLRRLAARHRQEPAVASDLDGAQHRDLEHRAESTAVSARCQRRVSGARHGRRMPPALAGQLLRRLVVGDDAAIAAIVEASRTSDDPLILVAAALFAPDGDGLLARAEERRGDDPRPPARGHRRRAPARRPRARRRARPRPPRRPPGQRPRRLDRRRQPQPDIEQGGVMNPKLTASLMILAAVLANVGFTALGSIFNYPDVLDEPAGEVLASFRDHEGAVSAWFSVLALAAALLAPIAIGVGRLSSSAGHAHRGAGRRSRRPSCRSSACCAGRSSCPATRPTRPAQPTSPPPPATRSRRRATSSARRSARRSAICSPRRGPRSSSSRSVAASPAAGSSCSAQPRRRSSSSASSRRSDLPVIDTANFLGYVLWSVWLIAFAVVILVRERRAAAAPGRPRAGRR